ADERRWFLLNASPDVRAQIEAFPPLGPPPAEERGTSIEAVLLTSAELDQTLGLMVLREGGCLRVHATAPVRRALTDGIGIAPALQRYCGIEWHEPPREPSPLLASDGAPSGLRYAALGCGDRPPRYLAGWDGPAPDACVGYCFVDERTGGRMMFAPGVATIGQPMMEQLQRCDLVLLDGTF